MSEDKNDQINDEAISNLSQEQDHQSQPDKLETTEEAIPTGSEMSQDSSNVGTSNAVEQSPQSDAEDKNANALASDNADESKKKEQKNEESGQPSDSVNDGQDKVDKSSIGYVFNQAKNRFNSLNKTTKKRIGIISGIVVLLLVIWILFATHVICFHNWSPATCTEAETCVICGETRGEALGHEWIEATCTEPETCSVCGAITGVPNGHEVAEWIIDEDSTCAVTGKKHGICSVCNEEVISPVELKDHTPGEWEVVEEATESSAGERVKKCTVCGEVIQQEEYTLTPAQVKDRYIKSCQSYAFKDLARNADALAGKRIVAKGEVIQVQTEGNYYAMRVNITKGSYGIWSDTVYVVYLKPSGADNIIEDDIITFYGEIDGNTSYTSVMGATITLPKITAEYIDIN